MLSKNNHAKDYGNLHRHYALRKLSIGVASVLLSTTVYLGTSQLTAAADAAPQPTNNQETPLAKVPSVGKTISLDAQPTAQQADQSQPAVTDANVPAAQQNVGNLLTKDNVSNVKVKSQQGSKPANKPIQPGSTQLSFDFTLGKDQAKSLKAGDYFDIQMGLPYTVSASGQTARLGYGQVVDKNTPIPVASEGHVVGYIVPVNSANSYVASVDDQAISKNNTNATTDLGGTNGYYRLIFIDEAERYGAINGLRVKIALLNWYNHLQTVDADQAPLDSKSFQLYSPERSINEYHPQDDLQIGHYTTTSGVTIKVKHSGQTQLNKQLQATTSTKTAAHWWYQRQNGTWVLGYNSLTDPSQSEGIVLTKDVGNDFTMTVTKPADNAKVKYFFADADRVEHDIQREIVGQSTSSGVDPVSGQIFLGTQDQVTKPKVTVTRTGSGNTVSYHVHIEGAYAGFAQDLQDGAATAIPSAVTLLSWQPVNPTDLLPPAGEGISDFDSDKEDAIQKKYPADNHVGGVMVDPGLIKALQDNPWKVSLTKKGDSENLLPHLGANNEAGYQFVKNPRFVIDVPNNFGSVVGHYTMPETKTVKQVIHYWYDQVGGRQAAPDVVRTGQFVSVNDDHGPVDWLNVNPEAGHGNEMAWYDVDSPTIAGYQPDKAKAGFQGYFTWNDWQTHDTKMVGHYDAQQNAQVIDVVYTAESQKLNYQVVLEDSNGNYVKTWVAPTKLAAGPSDSVIPDDVKQTWDNYLNKTYKTVSYNGKTYHIVLDNHSNSKLKVTTSTLPSTFDHNSSVDQLVTIYLASAPAPVKQQAVVNYQVVLEDNQGQPVKTVASGELGQGDVGTPLSQDTRTKWGDLLKQYNSRIYNGTDYQIVNVNDPRKINKTAEIPADATYAKQTYTIYLAPVTADVYYRVILENDQGEDIHTVDHGNLGQGNLNAQLSPATLKNWDQLVDHWQKYSDQGISYQLVSHNDPRDLSKTDEIPTETTYTNQTYTIYLAPVAADIYYQVKLEDTDCQVTDTLVPKTSLSRGEGHEGQALTAVEKDKWQQLLHQYATYTTPADQNGKTVTYRLVASDDPNKLLSHTQELPKTFDNQTYTIYLVKDHESIPWTPLTPANVTMKYQVVIEDQDGHIIGKPLTSGDLGTGQEGTTIGNDVRNKWDVLQKTWTTYTTAPDGQGKTITYKLVPAGHRVDHLKSTDTLLSDYQLDKLYTIYLIKDHESIPWTPLTPANVTMKYRVVIEDRNGQIIGDPLVNGNLGTGQEGTAIGKDVKNKWDALQKTWSTYTTAPDDQGKTITYKLVPAGHRTDQLEPTDILLPDYQLDKLYTIYLVKDHESIPWTPLTPAQPTPHPQPTPQPKPMPVPQPTPGQPTDRPTTPGQSTTDQPAGPNNNSVRPQAPVQQPVRAAQLPQTGDDYKAGVVGLGIMALLMGLGLAGQQRRHNN